MSLKKLKVLSHYHETGLNIVLDGFDIVVNDCFAHNGANKKIQLIDHHGCPVDDKLIRYQSYKP